MLILLVRKCEYWVLEITRDTKVLPSHSSSTRDLRLLYHLFVIFKTPYSQNFHIPDIESAQGAIFMEQNMIFGLTLYLVP